MMDYLLVKFSADWADEFDCEEMALVRGRKSLIERRIRAHIDGGYDLFFGTNQSFEDGDLDMRHIEIVEISREEYATLNGLLGKTFGTGVLNQLLEEPENDEDE